MEKNISLDVERKNISFKFNKTSKTLPDSSINDIQNKDFVTSVNKNNIKSVLSKPEPKELIIPLIKKNNWRRKDQIDDDLSVEEKKIKDIAIQEILKECSQRNSEWEQRDGSNSLASIPLIMQNKIPEGYETDDKMDVSLRPDASSLDDYDRIPVEHFGLALLRGMGWKEGDGIGGKVSKCVKPIEVQMRPKGLGLGGDASVLKKNISSSKQEKLLLIKGAYVQIIQGSHKGYYGQVIGLDDENARAIVKLSGEDQIKTFPEFFINLVTKKEFDKESKIINRAAYEKYKQDVTESHERPKERKESYSREYEDDRREKDNSSKRKQNHSKSNEYSKKRRHSKERSPKYQEYREVSKNLEHWVKPQLRVRLIDDKYKKGRYFNIKVIVVDVLSANICSCKTEDHKYLDDISPSMLETVIPRQEGAYVMIVQGKYKGELCTILKRDKASCIATVQFLSDRSQALKIGYDSICEYVGEIDQFD